MRRVIPSPAVVLAGLALFVALAGSSFAAPVRDAATRLITGAQIKDGSVTGKDITNRSLTGLDLKLSTLSTAHVIDGSLRATDFKAGDLPAGPAGAAGAAGPAGSTGAAGPSGTANVTIVLATGGAASPGNFSQATAACPAGTRATGGGVTALSSPTASSVVWFTVPDPTSGTPTGWKAAVLSNGAAGSTAAARTYALCAS